MKLGKINLRNVSDLLSENEMKSVTGGYGSDGYGSGGGTCAYGGYFRNYHDGGSNVWYEECGVSKDTALSMQSSAVSGFRWCCDSCTPDHCLP